VSASPASAVVFAYHDIGVRCLAALLELNVDVRLVLTHRDDPGEGAWFGSVAELAGRNGLPVAYPEDPNEAGVVARVAGLRPEFLFSFYYRRMLGAELLAIPRLGAFNVHGSLLPRYRGRVPLNWAIIHGERETGVSLHRMEIKPDAGNLVAQQAVPILANDTAMDVFAKLRCAAEQVVLEAVPRLVAGTAAETPQDLAKGSYFSGRRPEDGRLDWSLPARDVHNLIRAVAPPWPGAFFDAGETRVQVLGSHFLGEAAGSATPRLYVEGGRIWADCADGRRLLLTALAVDGSPLDAAGFRRRFGEALLLPAGASERQA